MPIKLKVINNKLYIIDTLIKELDFIICSSTKERLCDIVENSFAYPKSSRCLKSINNEFRKKDYYGKI